MTPKEKREESMVKKYGSPEAVKAKRREWQAKSRINAKPGGFAVLKETDPDKLKAIVTMGGKIGKRGKNVR